MDIINILLLICGFIAGFVIKMIIDAHRTAIGVIDVDHRTEMCRVKITSSDLSKIQCKTALFRVNHNAKISRDEQGLL